MDSVRPFCVLKSLNIWSNKKFPPVLRSLGPFPQWGEVTQDTDGIGTVNVVGIVECR